MSLIFHLAGILLILGLLSVLKPAAAVSCEKKTAGEAGKTSSTSVSGQSGPVLGSEQRIWNPASEILFHPVGVVQSSFENEKGTPVQAVFAQGERGKVIVFPEYAKALQDLNGCTHVWLLYYFDRAVSWKPLIIPYRDICQRGLFSTRSPARPNPIGISVVRLVQIKGNELEVEGMDILNNTPLLDIKPYVAQFDAVPEARSGWLDQSPVDRRRADERFQQK